MPIRLPTFSLRPSPSFNRQELVEYLLVRPSLLSLVLFCISVTIAPIFLISISIFAAGQLTIMGILVHSHCRIGAIIQRLRLRLRLGGAIQGLRVRL